MKRLILLLILLSPTTQSWGPETHKYMCNEAIRDVWGANVLTKCIREQSSEFMNKICDQTREVMGEEYGETCRTRLPTAKDIHPATIPNSIFLDEDVHLNHLKCPLRNPAHRKWFCVQEGEGKAVEYAEKWLNAMQNAPDECSRIYYFCIASHYFTDSQSQLHQIKNVKNDCIEVIEGRLDKQITDVDKIVQASAICEFETGRGSTLKSEDQRIGVRTETIQAIIEDLGELALPYQDLPYVKTVSVTVLANRIDHDLATGLYRYLRENGMQVQYADSENFETRKYGKNIIILGGHGAPDTGVIAAEFLSGNERDKLEEKDATAYLKKNGPWTVNQKVLVIAGYRQEDTQKAWMKNKQDILAQLKPEGQ